MENEILYYALKEFCRDRGYFKDTGCHKIDYHDKVTTIYEKFCCRHKNSDEYLKKGFDVLRYTFTDKLIECNIGFEYDVCITLYPKDDENIAIQQERERMIRQAPILLGNDENGN